MNSKSNFTQPVRIKKVNADLDSIGWRSI